MNATFRKSLIASLLATGAFAATSFAQGGPGYGPGYGPGMMGPGYGAGMMGPGYGPGMMGGGPGRGYGPGGMPGALNLTDEQRAKIEAIREDGRQKNWAAMGQMRSEMFKLRTLYSADTLDANAIVEQQKKVDELRRQLLKSRIESRSQIEAVLTPEQRKQFRQMRPRGMQDSG